MGKLLENGIFSAIVNGQDNLVEWNKAQKRITKKLSGRTVSCGKCECRFVVEKQDIAVSKIPNVVLGSYFYTAFVNCPECNNYSEASLIEKGGN